MNAPQAEPGTEVDAVVVGAGFAGLYALRTLRDGLGLSVQAFDTAEDVGGTWFWNTYPGARSDTEVTAYCYSFDRALFDEWRWTERYPRQPEILRYLGHVADRYDLRRSIRFGTTVRATRWDAARARWDVATDAGVWSARFLVEGVGLLSSSNVPPLPGLDGFAGPVLHTSRWPRDGVDLAGRRVGVIGTGSTGVQLITEIAPQVGDLTVFQRSAQYTVPAMHGPIAPHFLDHIRADYEGYWRGVRASASAFGIHESDVPAMSVSAAEREAVFERQWHSGGGFQFMIGTFGDIVTSREANAAATDFIGRKIREIVEDPETARLLTPTDLYAKRPLCDDGYYATFNRPNVSLVDVRADPIVEVTPRGVRTTAREVELDVLVLATGFDAFTGTYLAIPQTGRDGVELARRWADRPRTWQGVMTAGFPNLFMIFGPMCPFTNQPPADEVDVEWIAEAVRHVRDAGATSIEVDADTEETFMRGCDEIAAMTLFPEVESWINGGNIEGKPKAVMVNMAGMGAHTDELARVVANDFAGFTLR